MLYPDFWMRYPKSVARLDWCNVDVYMPTYLIDLVYLIVLLIGIPIAAVTRFISVRQPVGVFLGKLCHGAAAACHFDRLRHQQSGSFDPM